MCDSATRKEVLGRVLRYRISITPKMPGRQTTRPSPDEVQMVLDEHKREDVGVCCTL